MKSLKTLSLLILTTCNIVFAKDATIKFEYYQRLIFLNVKVNNIDSLLFLLDTGANASAIDEVTSNRINLKAVRNSTVEGTLGTITVTSVQVNSLSVGKSTIKNLLLTKRDLSGSLAPLNKHLDGILGTDFLKHFVVSIDFQNQNIYFSKNILDTLSISIPLELDNGIPRVKANIDNQFPTFLRYDSGSSLFESKDIYINVTNATLETQVRNDTSLKPITFLSASGVGGETQLPVYKIKIISLGKLELNEPFIIVQPQQGYFAQKNAVGFFGNNLFEKYQKVTIDFIKKKIYLLN